jgi:hypothetical protein
MISLLHKWSRIGCRNFVPVFLGLGRLVTEDEPPDSLRVNNNINTEYKNIELAPRTSQHQSGLATTGARALTEWSIPC